MSDKQTSTAAAPETTQKDPTAKAKPGASWKAGEEHVIPKNRLGIVFFGLMLTVFLAAIDQVSPLANTSLC